MITILFWAAAQAGAPVAPPPVYVPMPVTKPASVTPAARATGVEIARLLNSDAVTFRQMSGLFDRDLPKLLAQNPDYQLMERAYPGISKAVLDAMRPEITATLKARLPALWDRLGQAYAESMTEEEMGEALAFFRSPTGAWLVDQMATGSDLSGIVKQMIDNPEAEITAGDLKTATTTAALPKVAAAMTPERARDVLRFGVTPAGLKLRTLTPRLLAIAAEWSNERTPDADRRIEEAVTSAMRSFIASADAARSGTQ